MEKDKAKEFSEAIKNQDIYPCVVCGASTAMKGVYVHKAGKDGEKFVVVFSVCKLHAKNSEEIQKKLLGDFN